jgi:hypothetical protein
LAVFVNILKAAVAGEAVFFFHFYAVSLALPLLRLLAITFLPLLVLILFLKPCTLLACLFLG